MIINFPPYAECCLETIENNGFEAWFVGGCVRDSILNRDFYDVDIATNALPEEIEAMFPKTIPTGKKHGTITVIIDSKPIEVTTYRSESGYFDNRHPNSIKFESSIIEDLSRRDFTINAFAFHKVRGLLDLFDGISDLKHGIIRSVGDSECRFKEDALRILRAYRFASVLDFSLEKKTKEATYSCGKLLLNLSGERILAELKKLSCGKNPLIIKEFVNKGFLGPFGISEFTQDIYKILKIYDEYKASALIFLANHNLDVLKSTLKPDNRLIEQIETFNLLNALPTPNNKAELKLILRNLREKQITLYTEFVKIRYDENISSELISMFKNIFEKREPFSINHLNINGHDLLELGIRGEDIKKTLSELLLTVIENPELNTRDDLIALTTKFK